MLTYINIKNFAIIKDLELDLESEMTSLTGETGAGKSIIIDSLELALGARADVSLIRNHTERGEVTVVFDLTDIPKARDWLIDQELDSENECVIRRIILSNGRSKSSINGNPCTQQTLRTISEFLLNIHGQHEHQNLLNPEYQRELLDAFADNQSLTNKVKKLYINLNKSKQDLLALEVLAKDHETKIDFLNYQLKELAAFDLNPVNIENLHAKQKQFSNIEKYSSYLHATLDLLTEKNSSAIIPSLYNVKNQLTICKEIEPQIATTIDLIQSAIIQTEEACGSLRQNLNSIEFSHEHHQKIEEELTAIYSLARKHQTQPEKLFQVHTNLEQQLVTLQNITSQLTKTGQEVKAAEKAYLDAANELSVRRKLAATTLNQMITQKMQLLNMTDGKFAVNFTANAEQKFSIHGLERIDFLVSTNPGQPLYPLNKIISGGELSRISLAIQVITAEKEVTPTLIFDEIDAGIGGRTADIVGKLLRMLAEKTQVICITHLPQIAAQSHHHISVAKTSGNKNTEVAIATLNKNERIREIARMLGGANITKQTLAHAAEMLNSVL